MESDEVRIFVIDKSFVISAILTSSKFGSLFFRRVYSIFTKRIEEDLPFIRDNFRPSNIDKKEGFSDLLKQPVSMGIRKLTRTVSAKNLVQDMSQSGTRLDSENQSLTRAEFRNSLLNTSKDENEE